jgi:outer membrane receptor protein involved in Fe transport
MRALLLLGPFGVTAQKRAQSINEVPLVVTAISGSALVDQGVASPSDLAKIVPGPYSATFVVSGLYVARRRFLRIFVGRDVYGCGVYR